MSHLIPAAIDKAVVFIASLEPTRAAECQFVLVQSLQTGGLF